MDPKLNIFIFVIFVTSILADLNSYKIDSLSLIRENMKTPAYRYGRYSQDYQRTLRHLTLDIFSGPKSPSIKMKKSVHSKKKVHSTLAPDIKNITIYDQINKFDQDENGKNSDHRGKETNHVVNFIQNKNHKMEVNKTTISVNRKISKLVKRSSHIKDSAQNSNNDEGIETAPEEGNLRLKKKYQKRYRLGFKHKKVKGKKHKKDKSKHHNTNISDEVEPTLMEKDSHISPTKELLSSQKHKNKKSTRHGRHYDGTNKNNMGNEEIQKELFERYLQKNIHVDIKDVLRPNPGLEDKKLKQEHYNDYSGQMNSEIEYTTRNLESIIYEKSKVHLTQKPHHKKYEPKFKFSEITNGTINYIYDDDLHNYNTDKDKSDSSENLKYSSKASQEIDNGVKKSTRFNKHKKNEESYEISVEENKSDNEDKSAEAQDTERLKTPRRTYVEKREESAFERLKHQSRIQKNVEMSVPEQEQDKILQIPEYRQKKILQNPNEILKNVILPENSQSIIVRTDMGPYNRSRYFPTSYTVRLPSRAQENMERAILSGMANQRYQPAFHYDKPNYKTSETIIVSDKVRVYPAVKKAKNYKVVLEDFDRKIIKPWIDDMLGDVHDDKPKVHKEVSEENVLKGSQESMLLNPRGEFNIVPEYAYNVKETTQESKVKKIKIKRAKNSQTVEESTVVSDSGESSQDLESESTEAYQVKENVVDIPDDREIAGPVVPNYAIKTDINIAFPNKHHKGYVMPDYVIIPDRKLAVPNKHSNGAMPDDEDGDLIFPTKHINIIHPAINRTENTGSDHAVVNIVHNMKDYVTTIGLGVYNALKDIFKEKGR